MNEPHTASGPTTEPESASPAGYRLVIRAQIIPETQSEPVAQPSRGTAVALIAGVLGALLIVGWISFRLIKDDRSPAPAASEETRATQPAGSDVTRASPAQPPPEQSPSTITPPVAPTAADAGQDELPTATHEVLPAASRNALQTIRGTIRVAVRLSIDKQGRVLSVSSLERGPSRYFERVSLEAAKQWTFTPAVSDEPRTVRVRFNFTRDGVTAQANSVATVPVNGVDAPK